MFSPVFKITNKSLTNLIDIEVANKLVQIAQLQADWELRLKRESLTRKIFAMSRYSGNDLRIDDVAKIVKDEPGRDDRASDVAVRTGVVGKEKDVQQILNLLNTNRLIEQMAYLAGKFKQGYYGEKDLVQVHSLIGERLMTEREAGGYRTENIGEDALMEPPPAVEVSFQVEDLFGWLQSTTKNEMHPIIKGGIMLFELIRICPFSKNNLLSAVSLFQLILSTEGYGYKKMLSVEEELLKNPDTLRTAVLSVERNSGDLTIWLDFVIRCMAETAGEVQSKVMNLVGDAPIFKSEAGRTISLSEREIAIMEEMTLKNEMTIKEIRNVLPMVSDDTILRDLKDLIDKKLIRKKGKTKGALYVMGKVRSYR